MELFGLISIPVWLLVIILIVTGIYLYFTWTFGTLEAMGLTTPKPIPIFGNLIPELTHFVPDIDVKNAKLYGKTYGFYFTRIPSIRTSDPDIIKAVCVKEFNSFTDHMKLDLRSVDPMMNRFLSLLCGEDWRQTRNVLTPSFTSGKLKQMIPFIDNCANELNSILGELADANQSFEVKDKLMALLTDVIATCAFGIELKSQRQKNQEFVTHAKRLMFQQNMFYLILTFIVPAPILKFLKISILNAEALAFFKKLILDIIDARQKNKSRKSDFLQLMLDAMEEHNAPTDSNEPKKIPMTYETVIAQSFLFFFAGFESASSTLSFTAYNLATHPKCQERLYNEVKDALEKNDGKIDYEMLSQLSYMDMVIHESLRRYPAAIRTDRECTQDCVLNEIPIKKGMLIGIQIYALMNDEDYYKNPEEFRPERFEEDGCDYKNSFTYLAFGVGPRNCIGMRFALMEIKMVLIHVLKDFKFVVAEDTQVPLKFLNGRFNLIPEKPIKLKVERRN
ncbi:hypothetical protein CHUAL_005942 [Chamberlinius hualienensis]